MMKVYIAAPFFTPEQLEIVKSVELALFGDDIAHYSPRHEGILQNMSVEEQRKSHKKIFESNLSAMDDGTHMIACVQSKDTGTIFEMGYFCAQQKPYVMMTEDLSKVNVMLGQGAMGIATSPQHAIAILKNQTAGVEPESWT